jgi:hypothetical protein
VPLEAFEDFMGPLRRNRPFIAHVKDLPNASTREILAAQQIQSILVLPVQQKGVFSGFVGFDSCAYERSWTANEITLLEAFVELLPNRFREISYSGKSPKTGGISNIFSTPWTICSSFSIHGQNPAYQPHGHAQTRLFGNRAAWKIRLGPPRAGTAQGGPQGCLRHTCRRLSGQPRSHSS